MSRYKALRIAGCDPLTACVIATMNRCMGVPKGLIRFMHMTIEYEDKP